MIVKAKSLGFNSSIQGSENNLVFTGPQTMKISTFTPKKNINDYLQTCTEIHLKNSIFRNNNIHNSRVRIASPSILGASLHIQGSQKINQYNHYLKNYVKKKNSSFSPILRVINPIKPENLCKKAFVNRCSKSSHASQRHKHQISKRGRPARFLSQEDLENHIGQYRDRTTKFQSNKEDMKILLETNHETQLKSLEIDKICRHYNSKFKKQSIIKKND